MLSIYITYFEGKLSQNQRVQSSIEWTLGACE